MNTPLVPFEHEKGVALRAVREAAGLCARVQQRRVLKAALTKGDRSPVTIADFGSQAIVCRKLALECPADVVMGEEDAEELRAESNKSIAAEVFAEVAESIPGATMSDVLGWIDRARGDGGRGRFWTLDPIDGTKGYLRGEQYAIALALLVDGVVQVAVLACPNLRYGERAGCVVLAVRGRGCELLPLQEGVPVPARASKNADPREARLLESVEAAHGDHASHELVQQRLGIQARSIRLDSQAKYAVLARGEAEVYLRFPTSADYRENVWDHAAGALVLEEAGGRVTDVDGRALDFTAGRKLLRNRGIVATNGVLHEPVLAAIRAQPASPS